MLLIFLEQGIALPVDEVSSIVRVDSIERAGTLPNIAEHVRINTKHGAWFEMKGISFEDALTTWAEVMEGVDS